MANSLYHECAVHVDSMHINDLFGGGEQWISRVFDAYKDIAIDKWEIS